MKTTKIIRRIFLAGMFILLIVYLSAHYDKSDYSGTDIEGYVRKMCEIYDVPGLSVAIIDDDNEYYISVGETIDEHSRFELASTTKAFTALGILKLEKEGKLVTSDIVSDYLPWFKPTYKGKECDITIEELLCHTSGIPAWTISTIPKAEEDEKDGLERTIRNIKDVKLNFEPGTRHEYATINYDILALILELVTGKKYENYIRDEILKPLDMNESFFRISDSDARNAVQGHKTTFFLPLEYNAPTYYGNTAAGYLVSSASDLKKWLKVWSVDFKDSSVFSDLVGAALSHEVTDTNNYFAGWNIYDDYFCHGGNNPNYSSQVIIARDRNQGVFVLSNLAGSSATMIADGIYRILLGERVKIGLQLDYIAIADFFSIEVILLVIYLLMLLWNIKSKKACIVSVVVSIMLIVAATIFPVVFHYPYSSMLVWLPVTTCIAIGLMVAGSVILTSSYLFRRASRR